MKDDDDSVEDFGAAFVDITGAGSTQTTDYFHVPIPKKPNKKAPKSKARSTTTLRKSNRTKK